MLEDFRTQYEWVLLIALLGNYWLASTASLGNCSIGARTIEGEGVGNAAGSYGEAAPGGFICIAPLHVRHKGIVPERQRGHDGCLVHP